MAQIFIIGAAGKVGLRLTELLTARGHKLRAMHRKPEQAAQLRALGAEAAAGDLLTPDAGGLAQLMAGSDAAVFTAGAGGKGGEAMTNAIDGKGLDLAIAAAKQAGIKRFLLVSVLPEAWRERGTSANFENYMKVKKLADSHLTESGLD